MISLDNECHMATYSGQKLDLLAPDAAHIHIDDIVHGLAYQSCFNGQTRCFYSLAQHSLLVAGLVPQPQRLAALLHDAVAAYCGDITQTLRLLMPDFSLIEKQLKGAIRERFAFSDPDDPVIQRAHLVALATEYRDVCPSGIEPCGLRGRSAPIPRRIEFMSPDEAKHQFKAMYAELVGKAPAGQPLHAVCRISQPMPSLVIKRHDRKFGIYPA